MAIFPSAVSTDSDLFIAVNQKTTQLTDNPLTAGATTANVISTTGFPTVGYISIDGEIILYSGTTATSFTGLMRGADGTTAAAHAQNSQVYHNVVAAHHNVLKDEVKAIEQNLSDRIGLGSTQLKTPDGTAGAPSHSFANATDLGMFFAGAGTLALATAGVTRLSIGTAAISPTLPFFQQSGTATDPVYSFSGDQNTGIFNPSADAIGFTAGGTSRLNITSTDVTPTVPIQLIDGTVTVPGLSFNSDLNLGLYRVGTDELGITTNGTLAASFNSSQQLNMQSHKITSLANGTASADAAAYGQLKVIQIVTGTSTTADTTTSNTFQNTSLAATITPTSASNKVLAIVTAPRCQGGLAGTNSQFLGLKRGSTNLGAGNGFAQISHASGHSSATTYVYLDSPATTSATTYTATQLSSDNTSTVTFGGNSTTATITLIEVVA